MNEFVQSSVMFGVFISLMAYEVGRLLQKKTKKAFCNPLLIGIILVIIFLLIFDIEYDVYFESAKMLGYLLTPATVCLAIPLYEKIQLLKENWKAIIGGIAIGTLVSLFSILVIGLLLNMEHAQYVTLLPKSITTAIGLGVSEELGGYGTITVACIVITGILGNVCAEWVCKVFQIKSPIAKGVAIGTSAHALGTARAMEMGRIEGAMSSLSIVVAGIMTVVLAPLFAGVL